MAKKPLFSIIIPTRNRAHLLPYSLQSALNQQFDDYEIVVVANDCQDNTREVVHSMMNHRVRYIETGKTLSMPDNWEFAWTQAEGDYVTYLCDDDALTPSALKMLAEHTLHDTPSVVSWEDAIYYYPDWNDKKLQNILLLFYFGDILVEDIPAAHYLNQLVKLEFAWSSPLPKLLNCLANRKFFEERRLRMGRLFYPIAPDYSFSWISSHICSDIRVLHRPLSIRGISDHSIGSNAGLGASSTAFFQEFGDFDFFKETHLKLPLSINHLAATFLRVSVALSKHGVNPAPLDKSAFAIALAKQLNECRHLLPDWSTHKQVLLDYAQSLSTHIHEQVTTILSQPLVQAVESESLRDMHARTARMAAEYSKNLEIAAQKYLGDEECGACTLALRKEVLVEPEWSYLYLFGEAVDASDIYKISTYVDYYYDLMSSCRKKKMAALNEENMLVSAT